MLLTRDALADSDSLIVATQERFEDAIGDVIPPGIGDADVPLAWWNVLILVNADSPAGLEIVRLYRTYYPEILDEQVVYLTGLTDSASLTATPATEIITRDAFETHIAQPTRAHLLAHGLQDQIYVIITTAGMPYRIEDTDPALADVIKPAGSAGQIAVANRHVVNAASVESELSCLFQIDPAEPALSRLPITGRVVNPYQGYRSSIKKWAEDRDIVGRRNTFRWTYLWRIALSPKIEGVFDPAGYSALERRMFPGDLYLVARLDGPRPQGKYPIWSVREMLERSARVSNLTHPKFVGYNFERAVVSIDHSSRPPAPDVFASSDIYNVPAAWETLAYADFQIPPGAEVIASRKQANHYYELFRFLTGVPATVGATGSWVMIDNLGGRALWDDSGTILNDAFLTGDEGVIGVLTYGRNGGDGRPKNYLLVSGPGGGPLFRCAYGAVFTSLESFNAVTFFSSANTYHAKIGEFVTIGGTAAAGHAFEPEGAAAFHGEFLYSNLLRDDDGDGIGDLTLVESAFTGTPFVSWAELVIGDPLMRMNAGPGGVVDITVYPGDVNGDLRVGFPDMFAVLQALDTSLGHPWYNLQADLNQDGTVNEADVLVVMAAYGMVYQ